MRQPQRRPVRGQVETGAELVAEAPIVLQQNYDDDAAERSRLVLSQLDSMAASGQDQPGPNDTQLPIQDDFLEYQLLQPLTTEARNRITDILTERRRSRSATVEANYPITPVPNRFDPEVAESILTGGFGPNPRSR